MTVNAKQYNEDKKAFFMKHNNDFAIDTTGVDEYGRYYKTYSFEDGAMWYEVMCPVCERAEVEIKMLNVVVEVELMRVEYYSTDDSRSKYYYEKY